MFPSFILGLLLSLTLPMEPRHITLSEEMQQCRVVIVGDIHGCCDEFHEMLERYVHDDDCLILAGDLVNKGPKSVEVLHTIRARKNTFAVKGNHELASLEAYADRHSEKGANVKPKYAWTDALTAEDIEYMDSLPHTISLPLHRALVVHAGLVPGVPLEDQDPGDMVRMRDLTTVIDSGTVRYEAHEKSDEASFPWASQWRGPEHIYFGHDAKRKLQREPFATGLDTGCLYGGKLTAAVLQLGTRPQLVHVKAKTCHVRPSGYVRPPSVDPCCGIGCVIT